MNSNHRNTESEVRSMLDAYYAGTLSPSETHRLLQLMKGLSPLPGDLESDYELLQLLDAAAEEVSLTAVPDDLEDKLRRDLRLRSSSLRRRMRLRMIGWGAAASLLVAVSVTYVARMDLTVDLSETQKTAMTDTGHGDTASSLIHHTRPQMASANVPSTVVTPTELPPSAEVPSEERLKPDKSSRKIKSMAERTTRSAGVPRFSASDMETVREAFGTLKDATHEASRCIANDINTASVNVTASMCEMNTELTYITSAESNSSPYTSEIVPQP